MTVFQGDWICQGRWLNRVDRAKYWYTVGDTVVTVRMKNVLHADLAMTPISANNPLPRLHQIVRIQVLPLNPHKLRLIDHDFMMDEISWRETMNIEQEVMRSDDDTDSDGVDDSDEEISDDGADVDDQNKLVVVVVVVVNYLSLSSCPLFIVRLSLTKPWLIVMYLPLFVVDVVHRRRYCRRRLSSPSSVVVRHRCCLSSG